MKYYAPNGNSFRTDSQKINITIPAMGNYDNYSVSYEDKNGFNDMKVGYLIGATIHKFCQEYNESFDFFTVGLCLGGFKYDEDSNTVYVYFDS